MDLPYTESKTYFVFHKYKFEDDDMARLKRQLEVTKRRIVLITDPHIKEDYGYKVYRDGNKLHKTKSNDQLVSIWVEN